MLRAKIVAQSFTVDWLSNAPCVSNRRTATCQQKREGGSEGGREREREREIEGERGCGRFKGPAAAVKES